MDSHRRSSGPPAWHRNTGHKGLRSSGRSDQATMHFMEAATGHRCVDCHVREAGSRFSFEKDDKRPKRPRDDQVLRLSTTSSSRR